MDVLAAALLYIIAKGEGIEPGELVMELRGLRNDRNKAQEAALRDLEMAIERIKVRHG